MILRYAIVLSSSLFIFSCGTKSIHYLKKKRINVIEENKNIAFADSTSTLRVQYLGSGGLLLSDPASNIFIDPFFSNQSFVDLGRAMIFGGKIKSKHSSIQFAKDRILLTVDESGLRTETKALFSAHAHYDHLMDFPFLFNHWFDRKPNVYVNSSGFRSLETAMDTAKLFTMETIASTFLCEGKFISIGLANNAVMKVYPILASHNPHVGDVKFFSGALQEPDERFRPPKYKSHPNHWLEGNTFSFLVDIEKENRIELRMFIQSSSCEYPLGVPPESLLRKKSVDLAFLGVASYQASEKTYPSSFLRMLDPQHIVFIHWENFFRNYRRKPRTVPATNVVRFFEQKLPGPYGQRYFLPVPGIVFDVRY